LSPGEQRTAHLATVMVWEDEEDDEDEPGWMLATKAIKLALNNRVEEAQLLLAATAEDADDEPSRRLQARAGQCFLAFMVISSRANASRLDGQLCPDCFCSSPLHV